MGVAMKNCRNNRELAEDAVFDTILNCIEKGRDDFNYAAVCVKNYLREQFNKRKRQRTISIEEIQNPDTDDNWEGPLAITPPNQTHRMFVGDCVAAIGQMSDKIRPVMSLAARDWSIDEISEHLGIEKHETEGRLKYGRKLLRGMAGYGFDSKVRGHAKYIGIRRRYRLWEAAIRRGEEWFYLGHFDTASDAAKAYDRKARELFGDAAKLNFP